MPLQKANWLPLSLVSLFDYPKPVFEHKARPELDRLLNAYSSRHDYALNIYGDSAAFPAQARVKRNCIVVFDPSTTS